MHATPALSRMNNRTLMQTSQSPTLIDVKVLFHRSAIKSQLEPFGRSFCLLAAGEVNTTRFTITGVTTRPRNVQLGLWIIEEAAAYFFITVSSSRSILFCTRTVGMSPTSASTFSLQLSIAWNDSLSVVEKTSTHAWAPGTQHNATTACSFRSLDSFSSKMWAGACHRRAAIKRLNPCRINS